MLANITPLILTHNEAPNIGRTLEQLRWARDVVVVDSFSSDDTLAIISSFSNARVYRREFDTHDNQWNFGLKQTGIDSEWILALDADYILTPEFADELRELQPQSQTLGYRAAFTYCINGRQLRSGIYPPVTVLYRRQAGNYIQDGHTHKLVLDGRVENLCARLLHDDRKSLSRWFEAQSRYTKLEALKLQNTDKAELGWRDRIRRWRIVAPPAMLFYCLVVRLGVLDGLAGLYYACQRALAELMLSLYLLEGDLGVLRPRSKALKAATDNSEQEVAGASPFSDLPNIRS